jgi:hypothetical protein
MISKSEYPQQYTGDTMPYGDTLRSCQRLWSLPIRGPTVRRIDLTLVATLGVIGRKRESTCTHLIQHGKAGATKAQQD